jgi:hypothetical protein
MYHIICKVNHFLKNFPKFFISFCELRLGLRVPGLQLSFFAEMLADNLFHFLSVDGFCDIAVAAGIKTFLFITFHHINGHGKDFPGPVRRLSPSILRRKTSPLLCNQNMGVRFAGASKTVNSDGFERRLRITGFYGVYLIVIFKGGANLRLKILSQPPGFGNIPENLAFIDRRQQCDDLCIAR